jgi:hypothetical protein
MRKHKNISLIIEALKKNNVTGNHKTTNMGIFHSYAVMPIQIKVIHQYLIANVEPSTSRRDSGQEK